QRPALSDRAHRPADGHADLLRDPGDAERRRERAGRGRARRARRALAAAAAERVSAAAASSAGLSEQEAERRLAARGEPEAPASSRSYKSIVRANVFTVFNLILFVFGVLTLAFGAWQDAVFLGILVANAGIGIAQEIRAKLSLDRLAALVAPAATVRRDGRPRRLPVEEVLVGDLVELQPGDQLVSDGRLERGEGLLVRGR